MCGRAVAAFVVVAATVPSARAVADEGGRYLTVDGQSSGQGQRAEGSVTELQVAGRGGVAPDASAVALNLTVVGALAPGFVTIYPCTDERPNASALNYVPGTTVANDVLTKIDRNGKVCLFTSKAADLIADVVGWFPATSSFHAITPARLLDSRPAQATVDGEMAGIGFRPDNSITELTVAGRSGVAADASAVALNVTAAGSAGAGYVTVYPCADGLPTTSSLNFTAGSTVANGIISEIDAQGKVCLYTTKAVDLIADINGWFTATSDLEPVRPARLLETRPDQSTTDGAFAGIGFREAGSVTTLRVGGRGGVAADASAAVLNVTVVGASGGGYVSLYPCTDGRPNASSVNFSITSTVANNVIAKLDPTGAVCVYASQALNLVVDVAGWFPSVSEFQSLSPARLLDTRQSDPPRTGPPDLPSNSGTGRRVVYSKSVMWVWTVESDASVSDAHRVSGRMSQPAPGTYQVFSKAPTTCAVVHPDICMRFMVRFAHTIAGNNNIGFHEIPERNGVPLQADDQLGIAQSGGCVRQTTNDAIRMYSWAQIGTTVVVID